MCCPYKDRWRNTQAVQGNGLENRQGEQSPLEFESLFLRHSYFLRTIIVNRYGIVFETRLDHRQSDIQKDPIKSGLFLILVV